jgi:hypothetical protein
MSARVSAMCVRIAAWAAALSPDLMAFAIAM